MPGFRPAPVHVVHHLASALLFWPPQVLPRRYSRATTGIARPVETSPMAGALLYHPSASEGLARHTFQTNPWKRAVLQRVRVRRWRMDTTRMRTQASSRSLGRCCVSPKRCLIRDLGKGAPVSDADDQKSRAILANVTNNAHRRRNRLSKRPMYCLHLRGGRASLADPQVTHNQMLVELMIQHLALSAPWVPRLR